MILAQREMLAEREVARTEAQNEAKVRALEIERVKLQLAKARRQTYGQSSERGKLLVEQLELAIEDLEATQAEEETKAEISAPETAKARRRAPRGPRKLPDNLPVERIVEPRRACAAKLAKAPIAAEIVRRIDELFAIERAINGKSSDERRAVRQERSKPLVAALEGYMGEQLERLSSKNDTAKAIRYMLTRWPSFTRFLDDGRICLSNNAAERALRCVAVGRRNWTFAGSDEGGRRAAAVYSLIETCKLNDVDPRAWLADVLAKLPDYPAHRIAEMMPWAWKARRDAAASVTTAVAA